MNTYEMAKAYIGDAGISLREAKDSFENGAYHRTVRRAQECVELSLKGVLRLFGIEYPKSHDVSSALDEAEAYVNIPKWFREKTEELKRASRRLAQERALAFYGDERAFIPPEKMYSKKDAEEAIKMAEECLQAARRLLAEHEEKMKQG